MKLRNIKGFTLIELLAVILILGIIALIAVPTVSGVIEDAKIGALEVTIRNLEKAVSSDCEMNGLKGKAHIERYEIIDGKTTPSINIRGKLPNTGIIEVDGQCNVTIIAHDNKFCATKTDEDITVDKMDLEMCIPVVTDESYFTFENGMITEYSEDGPKNVVIPETIGGVPVTSIDSAAFYNLELTGVIIPDTVTEIGYGAFRNNKIKTVTLPENLSEIEASAFAYNELTKIDIPDKVTTIGHSSFAYNKIREVNLPNSLVNISFWAFSSNELESLNIPSSVTNLGTSAFNNNNLPDSQAFIYARNADGTEDKTKIISYGGGKKKNITIPSTVTTLDVASFNHCEIESITIPSSVTSIGMFALTDNKLPDSQAFIYARNSDGTEDKTKIISYGGARKENVIIPNTVTTIDTYAFDLCGIKSLTMPNSVTTINEYAFRNNELTSINLSSNLKTIKDNAFTENKLTSLTIPGSVENIGYFAFSYNSINNLVLEDGIKTIERGAFYGNQLVNLTIPSTVTSIADYAFKENYISTVNMPGRSSNNLGTSWYEGSPTFNFN